MTKKIYPILNVTNKKKKVIISINIQKKIQKTSTDFVNLYINNYN